MKKYHDIEKVEFKNNTLYLKVDRKEIILELSDISKKLANASRVEKEKFSMSPSGYGIHWPLIDEDLSIDGLLGIQHSPKNQKEESIAA